MELFGKYRLGKLLARGGMAEVYHGQVVGAAGFAREIAVKRILPELVEDEDFREMFEEEAKLAAQLDHPNIVQIFDFDHVGDSFYIVMEYVRGADLSKLMMASGRQKELIDPAVVVFIIGEVLAGLRYAHALTDKRGRPLGLVHRDISPANILLSYTGAVKLADFGIAKAATSTVQTQGGVLKGKYPYMSPEQASGEPLDRRSDIFSVGIILYQGLLGKRPFAGSNPGAVFNKLCRGEYRRPRSIVPSLPESLEAIIDKVLRVDPEDRYQSAAEFLADLREAVEPAPTREDLERCLTRLIPSPPNDTPVSREVSTVTDKVRRADRAPPLERTDKDTTPPLETTSGKPRGDARPEQLVGLAIHLESRKTRPLDGTEEDITERTQELSTVGDDVQESATREDEETSEKADDVAFVEAETERLVLGNVVNDEVLSEETTGEPITIKTGQAPSSAADVESDHDSITIRKDAPRHDEQKGEALRRVMDEAATTVRGMTPVRSSRRRYAAALWMFGGMAVAALIIIGFLSIDRQRAEDGRVSADEEEAAFAVLSRRSPDQWTELRRHGLDQALEPRGLKLRQLEYNAYPKLLELLRTTQVDLVNAPLSLARALTEQELIIPIDRVAREQLDAIRARFTVPAVKVGVVDTNLGTRMAFIPEYLEAHVMIYRVSKVAIARQRWQEFRPAIEDALAAVNGRGLPAGYELEADPSSWDEFDLFVVGYTWAHLDPGNPQPRLAFRSRLYWPSVDSLVERATLHGQTRTNLIQGQPLLDTLTWLSLHREHGLERPEVWARRGADRPSGTSITHWIAWDAIYLARVNQFRCAELRGHLRDHQMSFGLDDIAFARLPAGVSVQLDADGAPLRTGNNHGLVNAWLWGIPRSARDKRRSLEVVLDLVDVPHQTYFANRNCWIPTNSAVDTGETGSIEPYCRRAMAPGAETLSRTWFVYNPPNLEAMDEALTKYDQLWTDLFARRGYRSKEGGGEKGKATISVERIEALMKKHIPSG